MCVLIEVHIVAINICKQDLTLTEFYLQLWLCCVFHKERLHQNSFSVFIFLADKLQFAQSKFNRL